MSEWRRIDLSTLTTDAGWHLEDLEMLAKLRLSVARHGQLRPLLVCDGVVVDGRKLLRVMLELGWTQAYAVDVLAESDAAFSSEIRFEIDYAALAATVRQRLQDPDMMASTLAMRSPFTAERLSYFEQLAVFDWGQFGADISVQEEMFAEDDAPALAPRVADVVAPPVKAASPKSPVPPRPAAPPPLPRPVAPPRPLVAPGVPGGRGNIGPPPPLAVAPPVARSSPIVDPVPVVLFTGVSGPDPVDAWRPTEPPSLEGITDLELDTETTGLRHWAGDRPIGISCRRPDGSTFYLPWGHAGGNLDEETVKRWAQRELRGKRLTGANIGFDVHMLHAWGVDLEAQDCQVSDVQHYAALLDDNRRKFSLDTLAQDFLGKGKTGQDLDKDRMAAYHASVVAPYAEMDVTLTGELKTAMWPLLDQQELQRVRQLEDEVIYPVCEMERNAAPIDRELLKRWVAESETIYNECLWQIARETGFQMNPEKNGDWVKLFEHCGLSITHLTDKGAPSFTDDVLKSTPHPLVQLARKAGKISSLRSKFLCAYDEVVGDDGLLRFSLHQLRSDEYGTVRGRFSMSNKNLQQVFSSEKQREAFGHSEKDTAHDDEIFLVRKLFVAGSGLYFSADAAQIEYRLAAHFSASPKVLAAYVENPDIDYHNLVMELIRPSKPDITRKLSKALNFALVYGAGKDKVAATLGLPRSESDKFVALYDTLFPESKALLRTASHLAETRGYVKTITGRRARFPDKAFTHKALNAVIQGSAADLMKVKLVELHLARKSTGFTMRMTIHDSVNGDVPDQECAEKVNAILNRQTSALKVPITWSAKTGRNWAET
jgi:DNA polymerase I-like protein with 3'-5' exonuclease and polymerase domains